MAHPYSSQSDLEARISPKILASLTNDTPNTNAPDPQVLAALIEDADSTIDSMVGQVYPVPLAFVGTLVKQISAQLAIYKAYQRRSTEVAMPASWDMTYKTAMKQLQDIADLKLNLDNVTEIDSPEAEMVSNPQQFGFYDQNKPVSWF